MEAGLINSRQVYLQKNKNTQFQNYISSVGS